MSPYLWMRQNQIAFAIPSYEDKDLDGLLLYLTRLTSRDDFTILDLTVDADMLDSLRQDLSL